MFRRRVLERTAAAAAVGTIAMSGCLSADEDRNGADGEGAVANGTDDGSETELDAAEWVHDVGGSVSTVVNGQVLGYENVGDGDADGGVFALDTETGDHRWTFGESGGYSSYSDLAIDDAIYVGLGDDAIGSGTGSLHAIGFDGTERWTNDDVGSVYHRPRLANDAVYVGSDDGVVRAFETDDGTERWATDLAVEGVDGESDPTVAAVENVVFVGTGALLALDPSDGSVRWRYGDGGDRIRDATVRDGVAYVTDREGVVAVEGGERRWRTEFESNRWVRHVMEGRLVVEHRYDLHGLDADGEKRWVIESDDRQRSVVHDGTVYAGDAGDGENAGTVRAIDLDSGDECWSERVGDGESVESLQVVETSDGTDHALYVETDGPRLHEVTADGEVARSISLPGKPRSIVTDGPGRVIVGTREEVYALTFG